MAEIVVEQSGLEGALEVSWFRLVAHFWEGLPHTFYPYILRLAAPVAVQKSLYLV